ncbi:hypothetical protein Tco_0108827 [Tanacetum coccineum]
MVLKGYTRLVCPVRIDSRCKLVWVLREMHPKQGRKIHDIDADETSPGDLQFQLAVTTAATTTRTAVIRPKAKGLVIQEQEQASTTITSSKDKGKGIMVEEPLKMSRRRSSPLRMNKKAIALATSLNLMRKMRIASEKKKKPMLP